MKLENQPVFSHPSPPCKSYSPFGSDDDLLKNSPTSKSEKKLAKENPIGFGLGAFDQSVATLPFHMNKGDFQWEGTILVHPTTGVDSTLKVDGSADKDLFGKGMEFYTDENAMECEMPEFIVCIKESSCQSVKDICIDEGVPSQGKIWVQTREDIEKDPSALVDLRHDINSDLDTGRNSEPPILGGVKSETNIDSLQELTKVSVKMYGVNDNKELAGQDSPKVSLADDLPNAREVIDGSAEGGSIPESRCLAGETEADGLAYAAAKGNYLVDDVSEVSLNSNYSDLLSGEDTLEIQTSYPQLSSTKSPVLDDAEAEFKSEMRPVDVVRLSPSSEPCESPALARISTLDGSHHGGDTGSETVTIVVNLAIPKEKQEESQSADEKKPYLTLQQHFLKETSFSEGIHQPSSITYFEPIGYSGNISLRSESSAGSMRSFAFPVLQTEWYGSPVRMAKAGQKRSQKLRGWLQHIICCRF